MKRGYLRDLEDRKGRTARPVVEESMPEDTEILSRPEEIEGCCVINRDCEIPHPPLPSGFLSGGRSGVGERRIYRKTTSTDGRHGDDRERFASRTV